MAINPGQLVPKKPALAPASPPSTSGNAITKPPVSWHQIIVAALVVGLTIWLVEQNVDSNYAMLLALVVLLGAAYGWKGFAAELQAITKGTA